MARTRDSKHWNGNMGEDGSHEFGEQIWELELPAGGTLFLRSEKELDYAATIRDRYVADYNLTKTNDLALVGALISNQLELYRAQQEMNGMEPVVDAGGVPTGEYRLVEMKSADKTAAQGRLIKATQEVRTIEQTLGIDKKTRESGGAYTLEEYVGTLKKAAREMGLHISRRFRMHEAFVNGLRWRLRLVREGDHEDRAYHGVETLEKVVEWAETEMAKIEDADKEFAKERGRLVLGKL